MKAKHIQFRTQSRIDDKLECNLSNFIVLLKIRGEYVDDVAADARAGGGERVPDGDGAAAGVELLHGHLNSGEVSKSFTFLSGPKFGSK